MSKVRDIVELTRTNVVDADIGTAVQAYDATIVNDADIGVTVLAPDGDGSGLTGVDALPTQATNSGKFLTTDGSAASWGVAGSSVVRVARTSNTILALGDNSKLIDITSGTFTQTFTAATTLGDGWFCYIRNAGTGNITLDPNGAETIDSLATFIMYPGEVRLVQCDGTELLSIVLTAFSALTYTSTTTFTQPPGYSNTFIKLTGGGGGGGGGAMMTYNADGGGGGAGGAFFSGFYDIPVGNITVTVASGGTGGLGATGTTAADGNYGGSGGSSSVGSIVSVGGGAGGAKGDDASLQGAIGGSITGVTLTGSDFGGTTEAASIYGGGSGVSPSNNGTGGSGYGSIFGGAAGGNGAGVHSGIPSADVANEFNGGAGGVTGTYSLGGGGTGGVASATLANRHGENISISVREGGGGGATGPDTGTTGSTARSGNGGDGGWSCGGGGGGCGNESAVTKAEGGDGGDGGRGEVVITGIV